MLAAAWSALFSPASRSAAALMILSAMVSKRRTLDARLADFSDCAAAAAVQNSDVDGVTLKLLFQIGTVRQQPMLAGVQSARLGLKQHVGPTWNQTVPCKHFGLAPGRGSL